MEFIVTCFMEDSAVKPYHIDQNMMGSSFNWRRSVQVVSVGPFFFFFLSFE